MIQQRLGFPILVLTLSFVVSVQMHSYSHRHRVDHQKRVNHHQRRPYSKIRHRQLAKRRLVKLGHHSTKLYHTNRKAHIKHKAVTNRRQQGLARRKLSAHANHRLRKNNNRKLDYQSLPDDKYINPYHLPLETVDSTESSILDYFHSPLYGGAILLQKGQFMKNGNYTKYVRDLYRNDQLKRVTKDYTQIDGNYFAGTSIYIGDPYIPDDNAVSEMNYEQYMNHLQKVLTADNEDQKSMNLYFEDLKAQNRMLNFRDTRDVIFESILKMEEVIYTEQQNLVADFTQKDVKFEADYSEKVLKMMSETFGQPFYLSAKIPNDIFV